ncbi:hypothetical protein TSMG0043 [Halocynthia phage JM-2012]|uniref:hypothetical protein n=1 Tax=Halocynthia phage JM-2012 TaxID=1173297 RepID=UPI00025C68FA|nr:hypothetical protein TSMG0043 [Halocynthia phage JM-2012]AFI55326.1 hypothetical protein TSMG0043 [Halocynthia phage JM-2012]
MSGQYHETHQMMYVTSLDTLSSIEFTKENLKLHPVTKEKYTPNSELTNELIQLYPENQLLILGIIYELSIDDVISADEFTIMGYDSSLVGVQEINLIPELQTRLYSEYHTYINKDYADIEPYYGLVVMSNIAKQSLIAIKVIRLSNYKTTRACDFYIWTYINSKLYLEDLKDDLKIADIFYLYKNIDRLVRDSGSNAVLYELIAKFLTTESITTYQLNYVNDITGIGELESSSSIVYKEVGIGSGISDKDTLFSEYIEDAIASSEGTIDNYTDVISERMEFAPNRNKTRELKVFELVKNSTDTQILLTDIDVHVQSFIEGFYGGTFNITNHITSRVYSLNLQEVFILYKYIILRKFELEPGIILPHTIYTLPVKELPTIPYLVNKYSIDSSEAEDILASVPKVPTTLITREELDNYILEVKTSYSNTIRLVRQSMTRSNQSMLVGIYNDLYTTETYDLTPTETTYEAWLAYRGIDFGDFTNIDFDIIETYILDEVFNIDLSTRTSGYALALTELLRRFNNYNVNVRAEAGSDNLIDYHVSPLFSGIERLDVTFLDNQINFDINTRYAKLESYPTIVYNRISNFSNKVNTSPSELTANHKGKSLSYRSEVVTSMSNQYNNPIELRNL